MVAVCSSVCSSHHHQFIACASLSRERRSGETSKCEHTLCDGFLLYKKYNNKIQFQAHVYVAIATLFNVCCCFVRCFFFSWLVVRLAGEYICIYSIQHQPVRISYRQYIFTIFVYCVFELHMRESPVLCVNILPTEWVQSKVSA